MREEQMNTCTKSPRAIVANVMRNVLFSLDLFFESIWDWICWFGYELHLSKVPVFLTQKQEHHFRKMYLWLWEQRRMLALIVLVSALVIADATLHWSSKVVHVFGPALFWAIVERLFQVLLSMISVVIPLAVLAITFARNELGPRLSDTLILRLRLFALMTLGVVLIIALSFVIPLGASPVSMSYGNKQDLWIHRLGVWLMLGTLAFGGLLLTWLGTVREIVVAHRRFTLVADIALREYSAARRRDLDRYLGLARESIQALGLSFVPLSTLATGKTAVESTTTGLVVDINLSRLSRWVNKLDEATKSALAVVVWPGSPVVKGGPLIRIRGNRDLDCRICVALRSCFRVRKVRGERRPASHLDAIELVTERACRSVDDPGSLKHWIDLLGHLAELGGPNELDFEIYRAFSQIVRHVIRQGTEEAQLETAWQFYKQGRERLKKSDYGVVRDYIRLLAWQFMSSLPFRAESSVQRSVYYMLLLGRDVIDHARAIPGEEALKSLLAVLGEIAWRSAEMAAAALIEGRTKLAKELRVEVCRLLRDEVMHVLYSHNVEDEEDLQRTFEIDELLRAHFEASGFFLGALLLRRALQASLDPEIAAEGLNIALGWARTPAELFAALERIEAHGLWKGPERFQEKEIMSPLGESFWGDDRAPFLEVYILGSVARAFPIADWPKESELIQQLWPTLRVLCERMRTDLGRYKTIVPQLTEKALADFEVAHRKLVDIREERKRDEIQRAPLCEKAIAEFIGQAVESFRMSSILWLCFDFVAPQQKRQCPSLLACGRTFEARGPKEIFVRDKLPIFIAPGDAWAVWNDAICLDALKETIPVQGSLEEISLRMPTFSPRPEVIFVSPKARRFVARLPGFQRPMLAERAEWTGRVTFMGRWFGLPVLGVSHVPEDEAWLLNFSEACELIEYTEAKPRVEVSPDHPLEVIITFPQRLELKILNQAGVMRLRLGAWQRADHSASCEGL